MRCASSGYAGVGYGASDGLIGKGSGGGVDADVGACSIRVAAADTCAGVDPRSTRSSQLKTTRLPSSVNSSTWICATKPPGKRNVSALSLSSGAAPTQITCAVPEAWSEY